MAKSSASRAAKRGPVKYAVVGLGHIAQVAVLPAFAHAQRNSRLTAVVSRDPAKQRSIAKRYRIDGVYSYEDYEACLEQVDAVYIALPNSMHAEYTIRAARAGVHVLCEKPMAVTVQECEAMIAACREHDVKLMIAYRLHFEALNLRVIDLVRAGRIGVPKYFNSSFSMTVRQGDIRTRRECGGGTLYDIGVYCINAARYLFRAEPAEVMAVSVNTGAARLKDVDESTAAILRFENERVASFVTSFNADDVAAYRIVGTKGHIHVEPAYEYAEELAYTLTVNGRKEQKRFGKRDQFAPELLHFSDCILRDEEPEPSG
jgi:predicted dehydrogenase